MAINVDGLLGVADTIGQIGAGLAYADYLGDKGDQYAQQMGALGAQLQADSQFKTYGITPSSAIGGATQDAGMASAGSSAISGANATMGQAANMLGGSTNALTGQATAGFGAGQTGLGAQQMGNYAAGDMFRQQSMQGTGAREQEIYNRAMAMQQPALDAQRAQMNAREFAQGRSGIRGSQFGGTGEDAAMARAQAQAMNTAAFQSMGQAQAEQLQQANIANMYGQQGLAAAGLNANIGQMYGQLGTANQQADIAAAQAMGQIGANQGQLGLGAHEASFAGMDRATAAAQVANQQMQLAQTGQLTGAGYAAQLGLGGIQTGVNADKAASELMGNIIAAQINASAQQNAGGGSSGGLFSQIGKAFGL